MGDHRMRASDSEMNGMLGESVNTANPCGSYHDGGVGYTSKLSSPLSSCITDVI